MSDVRAVDAMLKTADGLASWRSLKLLSSMPGQNLWRIWPLPAGDMKMQDIPESYMIIESILQLAAGPLTSRITGPRLESYRKTGPRRSHVCTLLIPLHLHGTSLSKIHALAFISASCLLSPSHALQVQVFQHIFP